MNDEPISTSTKIHRAPARCRRRCGTLATAALLCLGATGAQAVTVTSQVSNNNDDAEERVSNGNMSRGSSDLELMFDGSNEQLVGVRFLNVAVPAGVIVTDAYIQFTTDEVSTGSASVVVHGESNANPAGFSSSNFDISNRPLSSASVAWNNIPQWNTVGERGLDQRTPSLAAIVTELIGDPSWSGNGPMVFVFSGAASCTSSACRRTAESRNGSSSNAPELVIEYITAPPNSADLSVTIADSPDPVDTGKLLNYTLTVGNAGPLAATGVTVVDSLPPGVSFLSATSSQGTCSEFGGTVTCVLGDISISGNASINIVVTAPATTGTIVNSASVSGNEPDPNGANDSANESTTVTSLNEDQLCYLVADTGGGSGGDDLLTQVDTNDFNPVTNEVDIGTGTGTSLIEAIAWDPIGGRLFAANANRLGIINTTTGVFAPRPQTFGTASGSAGNISLSDVDGLAFDATSGVLYGAHRRNGAADLLFQINTATGAHVPNAFGANVDYVTIGVIGGNNLVDDIAIDPTTGILYAAVNAGGSTDRLITVNKFTGAATDIAQITVPDIEGLGTDANGNLWGTSGTQDILYEINKNTGVGFNGRPIDNGGDYESVDCFATSPSIVADLAVTKSVDDPTPGIGDTVRFTIQVSNNGSGNATVVQISDTLPGGLTFVAASESQGNYDSGSGIWYVGDVNNGSSATLTIDASVDANASGTITNTAAIYSVTQTDPSPANDSDSASVTPQLPIIDLQKTSTTLSDPVNGNVNPKAVPGATVQYTLTFRNDGNASPDSDSMIVVDPLPANASLVVADFDGSNPGPVAFVDGSPSSGLTYTFVSLASPADDVDFSTDGTNFTYTPTDSGNGTDPAVTHIRIRPQGAFASGSSPGFELRFKIRLD